MIQGGLGFLTRSTVYNWVYHVSMYQITLCLNHSYHVFKLVIMCLNQLTCCTVTNVNDVPFQELGAKQIHF